jgi:N-acetyl-anhydromuramyl-L-alanine amidase AmpD
MFCTGGAPLEASASDGQIQAPRNPAFRSIVIHHSATHGGSAAAFERTHRTRLGGLAYHFVIGNGSGAADGTIETGYRWRDQIPGPHTKNQELNLESIAICLVGDFEKEAPTKKQMASLLQLLEKLCREGQIPAERIRSHREVDPETLCPGRGLPIDGIRAALAGRLAPVGVRSPR